MFHKYPAVLTVWLILCETSLTVSQHSCTEKNLRVINRKMSWFEARLRCAEIAPNGRLVSIKTAQDQEYVRAFLEHDKPDISNCETNYAGYAYWTSGRLINRKYIWTNENQEFSYFNWNGGEPNGATSGEECIHLWGNLKWNDLNCDVSVYHICPLCEF
ncbi:hypothetical protein HELRODRAFT_181719 [Helobdella robusta]|uniref:C-type lectin domain-containing protein n=1 Tax=Helobdella robusta TaxID=6412 RepID=T1FH92_HELRO|nr:hypothetical protein HELRODRAFT_181719 [Helobdella robusta]ESN92102.1 hypothetical protein HELRODRAFT_181719 [Helobdella robusta]